MSWTYYLMFALFILCLLAFAGVVWIRDEQDERRRAHRKEEERREKDRAWENVLAERRLALERIRRGEVDVQRVAAESGVEPKEAERFLHYPTTVGRLAGTEILGAFFEACREVGLSSKAWKDDEFVWAVKEILREKLPSVAALLEEDLGRLPGEISKFLEPVFERAMLEAAGLEEYMRYGRKLFELFWRSCSYSPSRSDELEEKKEGFFQKRFGPIEYDETGLRELLSKVPRCYEEEGRPRYICTCDENQKVSFALGRIVERRIRAATKVSELPYLDGDLVHWQPWLKGLRDGRKEELKRAAVLAAAK